MTVRRKSAVDFGISWDPIADVTAVDAAFRSLQDRFEGQLEPGKLEVLIEATFCLARDGRLIQDDLNRNKVWMFQLARLLKARFGRAEREGMGAILAPLSLVFVEVLSERIDLPVPCDLDWRNREDVQATFEAAWYVARYGEGEDLILLAYEEARQNPCILGAGKLGTIVSTAYHLQLSNGGNSFLMPVNEKVAQVLGTSKVMLGNYITMAIGRRFFKEITPYKAKVRARQFRFDMQHPDLSPAFRR